MMRSGVSGISERSSSGIAGRRDGRPVSSRTSHLYCATISDKRIQRAVQVEIGADDIGVDTFQIDFDRYIHHVEDSARRRLPCVRPVSK